MEPSSLVSGGIFTFGVSLLLVALFAIRAYRDLFTVRPVPRALRSLPRYESVSPWEQRKVDEELDFAYQIFDIRKKFPTDPMVFVQRYGIPTVYVFDADACRTVINDTLTYGRDRHEYYMMKQTIGDGLITQERSLHAIHRHLVDPAFKFSNLRAVFPLFTSTTDEFAESWTKKIAAGGGTASDDIYLSFLKLTLDIIGKAAFGIDFDSICGDDSSPGAKAASALLDLQETAMPPTMQMLVAAYPTFFSNVAKLPIGPAAKRIKGLQIMDDLVMSVINAKRKSRAAGISRGDGIKDMLDLLLEGDGDNQISDREMLDHVKTVLFAGHHTTTSLLIFLFLSLADKPDMLARVRKEITDVVGESGELQFDDLNKLVYLNALMKETLRMFSPISKVVRSVDQDTTLMGTFLPAGTNVDVCISALQMDPLYWPNPEKFDPERWMPNSPTPASTKGYMPFIHGARNCIGSKFFQIEAKVILCKLLPKFDFSMPADKLKATKRALYFTLKPDPKPIMTLSFA